MTPPTPHQFDRRRAEDVFKVVEDEVFPRIGAIDTKISNLESGINRLAIEGCAHRAGDLQRTQFVEAQIAKIFDKIDGFGETLSEFRVDVTKEIGDIKTGMTGRVGGVRIWILTAALSIAVGLLVYFAKDYAHDIETHVGKVPIAITQPKK